MEEKQEAILIADFLGFESIQGFDNIIYYIPESFPEYNDEIEEMVPISLRFLKFKNDWNALMYFVRHCSNKYDNKSFVFILNMNKCTIIWKGHHIIIENSKYDIDNVYKAILLFVKYYNQENG